jgi:hypothetical protein
MVTSEVPPKKDNPRTDREISIERAQDTWSIANDLLKETPADQEKAVVDQREKDPDNPDITRHYRTTLERNTDGYINSTSTTVTYPKDSHPSYRIYSLTLKPDGTILNYLEGEGPEETIDVEAEDFEVLEAYDINEEDAEDPHEDYEHPSILHLNALNSNLMHAFDKKADTQELRQKSEYYALRELRRIRENGDYRPATLDSLLGRIPPSEN